MVASREIKTPKYSLYYSSKGQLHE
uniref:Uncharacterized protein n=1 Tax=Anguilla anguilla TaxID=7936 RepID=A0A0E9Q939_ANGAN